MSNYKVGDVIFYEKTEAFEITEICGNKVYCKNCRTGQISFDGKALFEKSIKIGFYTLFHFETDKDRLLFRLKKGI